MSRILSILFLIAWMLPKELLAQCGGTGGTSVATLTVCAGGTAPNASLPTGRFYTLNVIGGLQYTITSPANNITLRDITGSTVLANTTGASLNYTATFSGQIRVYNCNASQRILTTSIIGGSNNIDALTYGSDVWNGYFYDLINGAASTPSNTNAFSRLIGTESGPIPESFDKNYPADDNTCLAAYSQGIASSAILNQTFAMKFLMNSSKPSGAYLADMAADDGIRLTVDGNLVFNRWVQQSITTYTKELFPLTGSSNLLLEYYENGGLNQVKFQNFTRVSNAISSNQNLCAGSTIAAVTGSNTFTSAPISSDGSFTVTYKWLRSTDNTSFSLVSGATAQNYTPVDATEGTYYYKRIATISRLNDGMPSAISVPDTSNTITITLTLPNDVINGFSGTTICNGSTAQLTFDPENATFATPYTIQYTNGVTSWTQAISSSALTTFNAAVNPATTTTYTITKITSNGCVRTSGFADATAEVVVRPLPTATITGGTSVCLGAASPNLVITNPQNLAITAIYSLNGGSAQTINIAANSNATINPPTNTVGTFNYTLSSVAYQNAPNCTNTITSTATVVVKPLPNGTIAASSSEICAGSAVNITFTATQGTGPFNLVINGVNYTNITSGVPFPVTPNITTNTTFNLTKITDANGCVLQNP